MREQTGAGTRQAPPSTRVLQLVNGRVPVQPDDRTPQPPTGEKPIDVTVQADDGNIRVIEFHPDSSYVQVWEDERFLAVLNRRGLGNWLEAPVSRRPIIVGRITLAYTRELGITITLPGITAAPIPADVCTCLRQRLRL